MEFLCTTGLTRPVRLCEATRQFAWDSLHGRYGDECMKTMHVDVDTVAGFDAMEPREQYSHCIDAIVRKSPVRLIDGERIVGSATLGSAIHHTVPAQYNGHYVHSSVSHVTLGFDRVLKIGIGGIAKELEQYSDRPYNEYLKRVVHHFRIWHSRYLAATREKNPECHEMLLRVPFQTPRTFHEAVQSLWFTFAFTRLTGNWPGIGRIDEMLGPYLKQDLADGRITIDEAREILAHFFIKGCEWIQSDTPVGTGDAQHYQNIVLAGIDRDGNEVTNEVTYLVLDIVEELGISDFPITVRLNKNTDERLLKRIAEVVRYGGGIIAVYNEELILDSLTAIGYDPIEARGFANDGCWEVQIPGQTYFIYQPFDSYSMLMKDVIGLPDNPRSFASAEELWDAYFARMKEFVDQNFANLCYSRNRSDVPGKWKWRESGPPSEVISLFTEDCAKNGKSYYRGGPRYTAFSLHIGGAPDAGNSIHAIDELCFRQKIVSFDELMHALSVNWEGYEELRQRAMNTITYYGNDDDEADGYVARILDTFADLVLAHNGESPVIYIPGVSTFGRQIDWMYSRVPSPMGTKQDAILAGNDSPTPGTDTEGATAVIKSYCKADLKKQVSGAALDIRLHPTSVSGENGIAALIGLMKTFLALGGFFMQTDVIDASVLLAARENPEQYKTLSVRVSGWNARFVTLNKNWQDMVIERTSGGSI
ncbi:MAG: hypothetical protein IJY35_04165 [Clostridia bacterium]|nr:hypothetical protein [Clostridia bacterium]